MTQLVISTDRPDTTAQATRPETSMLLINEALARSRHREAVEAAQHQRLVRDLTAGRRWDRLAAYAARRAERARRTA